MVCLFFFSFCFFVNDSKHSGILKKKKRGPAVPPEVVPSVSSFWLGILSSLSCPGRSSVEKEIRLCALEAKHIKTEDLIESPFCFFNVFVSFPRFFMF